MVINFRKKLGIKPNTRVVFELKSNSEASIKPIADFFSLKGSIHSKKSFDIKAMEKAIKDAIKIKHASSIKTITVKEP